MPQGERPSNTPEVPARSADNLTEAPYVDPVSRVDPYSANRELERMLYGGMNIDSIPRPDQRGTSDTYKRLPMTPSLPADWKDRAKFIETIIYNEVRNDDGEIVDVTQRREYPDSTQATDPAPESDK